MIAGCLWIAGLLVIIGGIAYKLHIKMTTGDQTQDYEPIVVDVTIPVEAGIVLIVAGILVYIFF